MKKSSSHQVHCILALAAFLVAGCLSPRANSATPVFAKGADVGWLTQLEGLGYTYVDETNTKISALQILKNHGVNTIRIRTFVNPTITTGSLGVGDNNQAGSIALAQLANSMGFQIIIDFHYSDTWADPGHQTIPSAWAGQTYAQLETSVYNYTYDFMKALAADGIYPQWVQVGNEINSGLLWPTGEYTNFAQMAGLINNGYNAVKAVSSSTQVIIHLANLSNLSDFEWFFDNLKADGGKFDVIGASYYDGPGTLSTITTNLTTLAARYSKPIMICEMGHASSDWDGSNDDVKSALQAVYAVPNGRGMGVIYWEPEAPDNSATSNYSMGAATVVTGDELKFTSAIDQFLFTLGASNQVINPNFASGLNGWQITPTTTAAYSATYTQSGGTGKELSFYSASAYNTSVWQTATALPNGTYTLTAVIENGGGQTSATMFAYPTNGSETSVNLPTASSWTTVTISGISVTDGQVYFGFNINAKAGNWTDVESVSLVKQ
ncbi:MAG: glycosyl hydrolase 53 family protein [Terracidiphilus sp.]